MMYAGLSFMLRFGVGGQSCSNFVAFIVSQRENFKLRFASLFGPCKQYLFLGGWRTEWYMGQWHGDFEGLCGIHDPRSHLQNHSSPE